MQMTLRYSTQRRPKDLPGRSKNPSASEEVLPQLQIHGEAVEFVTSFTHLGSTIATPEINRRCTLVASVMQTLWGPLWLHHSISRATKQIYNS